jgi:hypothetical protein
MDKVSNQMNKITIPQPKEINDNNIIYIVGLVAVFSIFIGLFLIVPDPTIDREEKCHITLCHQF